MDIGQIISIGLRMGGAMTQMAAAQAAQQEMYNEYKREIARQGAYAGQAMDAFNMGLPEQGAVAAQASLRQNTAERQRGYKELNSVKLGLGPGPSARDQLALEQTGARRAALGSYSDWQNQKAVAAMTPERKINEAINFAGGTHAVFPMLMYQAQHSQDALANMGRLMSAAGGGGMGGFMDSGPSGSWGNNGYNGGYGNAPYQGATDPWTGAGGGKTPSGESDD